MPASPRHRARCDRHEAQAGIVALVSCCLARLSNGGSDPPDETALSSPARTQRSACRGATLASRLDPLVPRGDKRGRSKALFFTVLHGASIADSDFCNLENPRAWSLRCDPVTVASFRACLHIAALLLGWSW